jgi:hypothetical protein
MAAKISASTPLSWNISQITAYCAFKSDNLPLDLIPIPNPHAALDLTDLALANLGGLALADLACSLALKLAASNSPTSASWWQPHPRPCPPRGLDLGLKVVTSTSVTSTSASTSVTLASRR